MRIDSTPMKPAEAAVGVVTLGWAAVRRVAANDVILASQALAVLIVIFFYDVVLLGRTVTTSSASRESWG